MSTAARLLGVTPSAVSQQIRKLEEHLGVTLLERTGRHVALTSWGLLFYREVANGFRQLGHAVDVLERARNQSGLVLTALSSVVNKWIGRRIFEWQTLHPEANIRIVGKDDEPIFGDGRTDFRITYGKRAEVHAHVAPLYTDWVVPACAPRLLDGRSLSVAIDILDFPLINIEWEPHFTRSPQWSDWARHERAEITDRRSNLFFALSSNAIDAAVSGHGFVLAQISMIQDELQAGTLTVPFDRRLRLPESYYLAWDRSAFEKPFGKEFHAWITAIGKRQAAASAPSVTM